MLITAEVVFKRSVDTKLLNIGSCQIWAGSQQFESPLGSYGELIGKSATMRQIYQRSDDISLMTVRTDK